MRVQTVPKFMVALEQSQLLHPRILDQIREQVAKASPNLTVEDLANSMLKARIWTGFQAQRLLDGHVSGFYVGEYKLFEVLGRGGMGTVYLAEQTSRRRLVALKVITDFAHCVSDTLTRFRREAHAALSLSHPNIVQAFGYSEPKGSPYMTMEYVDGIDTA